MKRLFTVGLLMAIAIPALAESVTNPRVILAGDYPDPSILRDGADYYMTHSPFYYTPGFLIWHSRDLVHWEPVCRAMNKVVGSAMAPDLVKCEGKFYIYFPAAGVNWVIWAKSIRGPWSDPIRLNVGNIDPGHAVGGDGKRYLFVSNGYRVSLSSDGLQVTSKPEKVYDGWDYPKEWKTEGKFLESPKIIHKGKYYYLISAEGGTAGPATSHMVVAARSTSLNGPWENSPYNPIVHTYSEDEKWWSKGHGTIIDDVHGNWWIVYHAYENGYYPLGRQTLLEPIEWLEDGWFRIAKNAHPISSLEGGAPATPGEQPNKGDALSPAMELSDDFSGKTLGLQWTTWRDYDPSSIVLKDQSLYLQGKGTDPKDARLLLITPIHHEYASQVEVTLSHGTQGGLILFYNEKAFAGLSSEGSQFTVFRDANQITRYPNRFGDHFFLKIINRQYRCELHASGDGKNWTTLEKDLDVSQMHHNNFKQFLALRIALMAAGEGVAKFNHFQYQPIGQ